MEQILGYLEPLDPVCSKEKLKLNSSPSTMETPRSPIPNYSSYATPPQSPQEPSVSSPHQRSPFETGGYASSPSSAKAYSPRQVSHCNNKSEVDEQPESAIDNLKSDKDVYRQRGAKLHALALLNETVAGAKEIPKVDPGKLTAKQAAIMRYEKEQEEKAMLKAKYRREKELYRPEPRLVARKELLAETTRKRTMTEEDAIDPDDTVASMKCQIDIEREIWAQKQALKLMGFGWARDIA
jgi:hypothetical protein